jgi:FKBP-type peptidyl-prolyl cis-trans isomerase FklB
MKLRWIAVLGIFLLASQVNAAEKLVLKDKKDKISYSMGARVGNSLKKESIDINTNAFVQGFKDVLSGGKKLMTDQEVNETLMTFQKEMMAKEEARLKELGEKNKKEGEAFLAENGKKEGIVTLPSGLQYKVLTEGTSDMPKLTDKVSIHYRGSLIDGTEFDSSYQRGQPATFQVNGVISGMSEALQLMKVGSKWQLFIPSNLAYGERGAGDDIGPNAALIFEFELLSIKEEVKKEEKKSEDSSK